MEQLKQDQMKKLISKYSLLTELGLNNQNHLLLLEKNLRSDMIVMEI